MSSTAERIGSIAHQVCDRLAACEGEAASLVSAMHGLSDSELTALLGDASSLRAEADRVVTAIAGVVSKRSERALGYAGLAQREGHRTPVAWIQAVTGVSRAEASRQVRMGQACDEADAAERAGAVEVPIGGPEAWERGAGMGGPAGTEDGGPGGQGLPRVADNGGGAVAGGGAEDSAGGGGAGAEGAGAGFPVGDGNGEGAADSGGMDDRGWHDAPWYLPITRAVDGGAITAEAGAAILRGLGKPSETCSGAQLAAAAITLIAAAEGVHVDELAKRARWARDDIDPNAVSARAEERYRARSWRFGKNAAGARTAWVVFDDESAAWMDALIGAALAPRRGGPRFVSEADVARAESLRTDERTNDQLVFDTVMDTLRAGACADAGTVFGTRQPGIRLVVTRENIQNRHGDGAMAGTGHFEDGGEAVPGAMVDRQVCNTGVIEVTVDGQGTPLDVGREQRSFTTRQRVALRVRDGGCLWPGCEQVTSYGEAHHINEWVADRGRTDTADGVLLCRHHHLLLHNNRWKIRRTGTRYRLIPPRGIDPRQTPIPLHSKSRLGARTG